MEIIVEEHFMKKLVLIIWAMILFAVLFANGSGFSG